VVVTRSDELGRRTVYDCLPGWIRADGWVPIGRLDADTRGLLLFTKDGDLVERLTRPGTCLKTYDVWVRGRVTAEHLRRLADGVQSGGDLLKAAHVENRGGAGPKSHLIVPLDEGKNRHLRRLFGALRDPERKSPLKVVDLKRIGFGPLALDLRSGAWRFATEEERASLRPIG